MSGFIIIMIILSQAGLFFIYFLFLNDYMSCNWQ